LHNGKVLFFTYPSRENHHHNHVHDNDIHSHGSAERTGDSEILDPISKESKRIILRRNIFCGASCFLEDGNLFVAGGQYQTIYSFWDPPSRDIHTFNTAEEKWIRLKDKETNKFMEMKARWYPTCLTLADGRVLIISGRYSFYAINFWIFRFVNNTLQIFDSKNRSLQPPQNLPFEVQLYPFMHLLPSGKVFVHSGTISRLYNPRTNTWDNVTGSEKNESTKKSIHLLNTRLSMNTLEQIQDKGLVFCYHYFLQPTLPIELV
jgi:Glyoxal oxidase N-terminus